MEFYAWMRTEKFPLATLAPVSGVSTTEKPEVVLLLTLAKTSGWPGSTNTAYDAGNAPAGNETAVVTATPVPPDALATASFRPAIKRSLNVWPEPSTISRTRMGRLIFSFPCCDWIACPEWTVRYELPRCPLD